MNGQHDFSHSELYARERTARRVRQVMEWGACAALCLALIWLVREGVL